MVKAGALIKFTSEVTLSEDAKVSVANFIRWLVKEVPSKRMLSDLRKKPNSSLFQT